MDLSGNIASLTGKIGAVPEASWNEASREAGYGSVQQDYLDALSVAFARGDSGAYQAWLDKANNCYNFLSASDRALYDGYEFSQGAVTTAPYTYQQALTDEMSAIGAAGAAVGRAAASPLAGVAQGIATGPMMIIAVLALVFVFALKR